MMKKSRILFIVGNIIHSLGSFLFLPAVYGISPEQGVWVSQGYLLGQICAVFGNYSFSIVGPRNAVQNVVKEKEIYWVSFATILIVYCVFLISITTYFLLNNVDYMLAIFAFSIGYSIVWFVQWYRILNDENYLPLVIFFISRIGMLFLIILSFKADFLKLHIFLVIFLCVSYVPNLNSFFLFANFTVYLLRIETQFFKISKEYLSEGLSAFCASLLTSGYQLGPSIAASLFTTGDTVLVQQFDRLRMIAGNFSGMIYALIYPRIVKRRLSADNERTLLRKGTMYFGLASFVFFVFLSVLLLVENLQLWLDLLQLTSSSLSAAVACSLLASASGFMAVFFYFPNRRDFIYLRVIAAGLIVFVATIFVGSMMLYNLQVNALFISVIIAELLILLLLYGGAVKIISER